MSVYFKHPPINEVVIATYFKPPLDLRSEHVGLFWSQIKREFPVTQQQPPVGSEIPVANEVFPMPRYWFMADSGASLIQVQKNAFMFNWRRQDELYPRYHSIKPDFDKYYVRFSEFVRTETPSTEPSIDLCELTYVNTIQQCEYWQGPQDTVEVIPSFSFLVPGERNWSSVGFNCNFGFRNEGGLHVQVAIRSGTTVTSPNVPILVLELKASEQLGGVTKSETDQWFDRAHEAIMERFLKVTSESVQLRYWKREQAQT